MGSTVPAPDPLRRAADKVEIQQAVARYTMAVDAKRWDDLDRVFAPGAVVDFTPNGGVRSTYPEVTSYLREAMGIFAASQHYVTNFVVDVDGDSARGRFYVLTQMVTIADGADRLLADGGYYDAAFVRHGDEWRITELVGGLVWLDGDWPEGVPRPGWYGVSTSRF